MTFKTQAEISKLVVHKCHLINGDELNDVDSLELYFSPRLQTLLLHV
jgi:hypothetical protein